MKKHLQHFFAIVVAVFLSMTALAQDIPDTLSTGYGDGMDTFVSNDDKNGPDEVAPSDQYLVIRNHEVRIRIAFLKFDIANNPRFKPASQAYIGLYVNHALKMGDAFRDISVYGVTDDALDNWDETTLTYNTAPGLDYADLNSFILLEAKTRYLSMLTVPADTQGWVYTEPTAEMDEFINDVNKNDFLTFILLIEEPNTGDELRFDSKEDTDTLRPPILHAEDPNNVENKMLPGVSLEQNFPNPFNGITTLTYNLNETENVELTVYNMLGAKVATLVDEFQVRGTYKVKVNTDRLQLSPGIYYAKIHVGSYGQTIKMVNCE